MAEFHIILVFRRALLYHDSSVCAIRKDGSRMMENSFESTKEYVASEQLMASVNVAIALKKPLLIKGEPGMPPVSGFRKSAPSGATRATKMATKTSVLQPAAFKEDN